MVTPAFDPPERHFHPTCPIVLTPKYRPCIGPFVVPQRALSGGGGQLAIRRHRTMPLHSYARYRRRPGTVYPPLSIAEGLNRLVRYDDIAKGRRHDHIHLDVASALFAVEKRMIYEILPYIKLLFNHFSAQSLLIDIFRYSRP